jgi:hypothetical protein
MPVTVTYIIVAKGPTDPEQVVVWKFPQPFVPILFAIWLTRASLSRPSRLLNFSLFIWVIFTVYLRPLGQHVQFALLSSLGTPGFM